MSGVEYHMIVMKNIFSTTLKIHKKYDLKGSTVDREASEKEKTGPHPTYKDKDFIKDEVRWEIEINREMGWFNVIIQKYSQQNTGSKL